MMSFLAAIGRFMKSITLFLEQKDWKITTFETPRGYGVAAEKDGERLTFRGSSFQSEKEAIYQMKIFVKNYERNKDV